jgi:hypothetical protein
MNLNASHIASEVAVLAVIAANRNGYHLASEGFKYVIPQRFECKSFADGSNTSPRGSNPSPSIRPQSQRT